MTKIFSALLVTAAVSSAWFMPTFGYTGDDSKNVDANFVRDDKLEVVVDKKNSKIYYDSTATKKMHFIRAWSYCSKMKFAGRDNWRVPTKDEAKNLLELSRPNVKSKHAFKNTHRERYWTSTEDRRESGWYVDFDLGRYSTQDFTKLYRVVCVSDD